MGSTCYFIVMCLRSVAHLLLSPTKLCPWLVDKSETQPMIGRQICCNKEKLWNDCRRHSVMDLTLYIYFLHSLKRQFQAGLQSFWKDSVCIRVDVERLNGNASLSCSASVTSFYQQLRNNRSLVGWFGWSLVMRSCSIYLFDKAYCTFTVR